jgi:hypothetical protein
MNEIEKLELIEYVFDMIEHEPGMQESFRFVGFTPEGKATTFYLNSLEKQVDRDLLVQCLHNPITMDLLDACMRKWIKIQNYYLAIHETWEKIQAGNLNMDTAPEIFIESVKNRFLSSYPYLGRLEDYGLKGSLSFSKFMLENHVGIPRQYAIEGNDANSKKTPDTNIEEQLLDLYFNPLIDDIIIFMAKVMAVRESHWRLRKRAIQDLIEGKVLQIDPKQFQCIQELLNQFQQKPKTSNQALWLRTALEENLLNNSGNNYYFLTKDNVRAFWKVLHTQIEKIYESSHDPRGMAIDQMPTPELAHQLIKRKDGKPYSVETFKSARKKI